MHIQSHSSTGSSVGHLLYEWLRYLVLVAVNRGHRRCGVPKRTARSVTGGQRRVIAGSDAQVVPPTVTPQAVSGPNMAGSLGGDIVVDPLSTAAVIHSACLLPAGRRACPDSHRQKLPPGSR